MNYKILLFLGIFLISLSFVQAETCQIYATNESIYNGQEWLITYDYTYDGPQILDSRALLTNTSNGISGFFGNINPVYAILAVLVIILVLIVLVKVVSNQPQNEERSVEII